MRAIFWCLAPLLGGCQPAQPPAASAAAEVKSAPEAADVVDDARGAAEASLGKPAQILLQGDLAQNGREQLLVVNSYSAGTEASTGSASLPTVFVLRAAVLEKNGGKWNEILLCDEHLKNSNGYLGGSSAARVNGWRLEYNQDSKRGLEMKFTPAQNATAENGSEGESAVPYARTFDVRWNKSAKRYETYDQSHERYLGEVPSLEIPQSHLK